MRNIYSTPGGHENLSLGTRYIIKYMQQRIKNDKNVMIGVIGPTGSGKSFATASLIEILQPNKSADELINHIHFSPKEFLDSITDVNTKSGEAFSFDEGGVGQNSKNWQSLINRLINYVLQTFRYKNLIVFFCLPHFSFLDSDTRKLLHAVFEIKKIDRKRKVAIIKPLFIQLNSRSGKMYFKYLRVAHNGVMMPIKSMEIPIPSEKLVELYQKKKQTYTKDLYQDIIYKIVQQENKGKGVITQKSALTDRQKQYLEAYQRTGTMDKAGIELGVANTVISQAMKAVRRKMGGVGLEELKNMPIPA